MTSTPTSAVLATAPKTYYAYWVSTTGATKYNGPAMVNYNGTWYEIICTTDRTYLLNSSTSFQQISLYWANQYNAPLSGESSSISFWIYGQDYDVSYGTIGFNSGIHINSNTSHSGNLFWTYYKTL